MSVKESITQLIIDSGAFKVGFSTIQNVDDSDNALIDEWLNNGCNADMTYMAENSALRRNPALLLPGAQTVISILYNYYPSARRDSYLPHVALYAYGKDYHDVIRKKLKKVVQFIADEYNQSARICIDSAPVRERYWARQAGLGFIGKNGLLITDEVGSYCFIAEIITTLKLSPDTPDTRSCLNCSKCIKACPTKAILPNATIDARRCLSYLTIEHRGDWSPSQDALVASANTLFGCDICQDVCPHNNHPIPTEILEFKPSEALLNLSADNIPATHEALVNTFPGSPLKRAKTEGLLRNASALKKV
jgi:epoxyqueuosine reductase